MDAFLFDPDDRAAVLTLRDARTLLRRRRRTFRDDREVLRVVHLLWRVVHAMERADDLDLVGRLEHVVERLRERLVACMLSPRSRAPFAVLAREAGLEPLDVEILMAVVAADFGLLADRVRLTDLEDLFRLLESLGHDPVAVHARLAPGRPLAAADLLALERDEDAKPCDANLVLGPAPTALLLGERPRRRTVTDARELEVELRRVLLETEDWMPGGGLRFAFRRRSKVRRSPLRAHRDALLHAVSEYGPEPLRDALAGRPPTEAAVLLVLWAADLGLFEARRADLVTGGGLARALSDDGGLDPAVLRLLRPGGPLRPSWVRPRERMPEEGGEDAWSAWRLCEVGFVLTHEARRRLGLPERVATAGALRRPRFALDDLVFAPAVRRDLDAFVRRARDPEALSRLAASLVAEQGRGTTALFHGPPGVGKTAAAEAVARALDRPLLVGDHSRLQSCWVGESEKNVAALFAEAADLGAVLFLDEADSFLFPRDRAHHSWEITLVNVVLQEVEAFPGVLVFATNAPDGLDEAILRRLEHRIAFPRPGRAERRELWRRIVAALDLELDEGGLDRLAAFALTGSEIRTALRLAASHVLVSGRETLALEDLLLGARRAATRQADDPIGFGPADEREAPGSA